MIALSSVAACVVILTYLVPTWAATYSLGLDISHWQGQIAWGKVAKSHHVFVFQKATEGTGYEDPTYLRNRNGAAANGIKFGAYHFSNPQGSTRTAAEVEAQQEADHFVSVASPAPGDLIPALDLENSQYTQAMPTNRLIHWVDAWLHEVELKVGVKPAIYTSPYFWKTKLNDTRHFADEGYRLWIAHWTSAAQPSVPGSDWGGNRWTFWQWTDCAKVPGIQGCVDEDRYGSADFTPVTIPGAVPSPTPTPTITVIAPSNTSPPTISGDATVGSTLSASDGTWQGSEPIAYSYAWYRCDQSGAGCSGITDGTGPTYTLVADDYGHTMKVTVTATNNGGSSSSSSAPTAVVADSIPPAVPMVSAIARVTAARQVRLAWTDTDADARAFDVRQRSASFDSDFGPYDDVESQTSSTSSTASVEADHTYCFSARARDEADNSSDWSPEVCTAVPVDDRGLAASDGWTRLRNSSTYLGTYSASKHRGAKLSLQGVKGRRIALVAERCSKCGRVRVYVNGQAIKDVRLTSAHKKYRSVIPIASYSSVTHGRVVIEVLSKGLPVRIDGLAIGR